MKSGFTIFLLTLLVFIQTPAGQVLKLPVLIEHFINHKKQDNVSFIGFLKDHYSSNHNDADQREDEQLPFKNIKFFTMGYAIVPALVNTQVLIHLAADKKLIFPDSYAPQQHLASIFHPPKG